MRQLHTHTHTHIWGTHKCGLRGGHNWETSTFTFMLTAYLQCVNFFCTAEWVSFVYIYLFFHSLFHLGLSQDTDYNPWCYTVGRCYLSRILIQNGPLRLSKLCSWLTPMKLLNVPLLSVCFSLFGKTVTVQLWRIDMGHWQPQFHHSAVSPLLKGHQW